MENIILLLLPLLVNYYHLAEWIVTNLDFQNHHLQQEQSSILVEKLDLLLIQQLFRIFLLCVKYSVEVIIILRLQKTDQLGVGDSVKYGKLVKVLILLKILLEILRYPLKLSILLRKG